MTINTKRLARRLFAPEVVQTSAMDCGPASLKCLLEGFNIPVSYGRLREACQTDVDGTSIDVIEVVANQLGIAAEQVMLPTEYLFLSEAAILPAIVVVRQSSGATHFVVVWRRSGAWLQIMDPALGRRWTRCDRFAAELYKHRLAVPSAAWREWAASDAFIKPLRQRLSLLGASVRQSNRIIDSALTDPGWRHLATLDAAVRMVSALIGADGINKGARAVRLLDALVDRSQRDGNDQTAAIPDSYWSVTPDTCSGEDEDKLILHGAVLLKAKSRDESPAGDSETELSPELSAALSEKPPRPTVLLLKLLKEDGLFTPIVLCGAMAIAVGGVLIETLLFRGLFDVAWELNMADQRLGAVVALMAFIALLLLMETPITTEAQRLGRHLETRMRMALLDKLPRLNDRYFQSRPISDMAERSHSLHLLKQIPGLGIRYLQALWDLSFTLAGIAVIDAASAPLAFGIGALAIGIPLVAQPLLNEQDLKVRIHAGALHGFYLDSMLGLVPIRSHRAENAIRREHEALLVEWARAGRSQIGTSLAVNGLQSLSCVGLATFLLLEHFQRAGVSGGVLLLIYWTLKLPATGQRIIKLTQQYPAQRNILLRLLEPLSAPEELQGPSETPSSPARSTDTARSRQSALGLSFAVRSGSILASGHTILEDINLSVSAGEHIGIVGVSGAGKSTLLGLLLGWHRLSGGEMLVDGTKLTGPDLDALRKTTAWVDPAIQIWNRPFLDNILYGKQSGDYSNIGAVIQSSDLSGVLQKLPNGMQTRLGEGGALLSGGEGQRIRLGRAVSQENVRLALLDEPFRGLDREQRGRLLRNAVDQWRAATLLCVTHDVSETLMFDRVLVVDNGKIIEDGNPAELAAIESRYRELLDMEKVVKKDSWQASDWRNIKIRAGRLQASASGSEP
ncbi:MAG: ATP-binding cassette domain-containing protein [Gammaproteobacteria bacterium]